MLLEFIFIAVAPGYLVCSVLGFGLTVGYFQREFYNTRSKDVYPYAAFTAIIGPIGLFVSLFGSNFGKHGLQFRATTSDYKRRQGLD